MNPLCLRSLPSPPPSQEWSPWLGLWCCTLRSWPITHSSSSLDTGGQVCSCVSVHINVPLTCKHICVLTSLFIVLLQGPSSSWAGSWPLKSSIPTTTTLTPCNHSVRSLSLRSWRHNKKCYVSSIAIFSCVFYSWEEKKDINWILYGYIIYWNMTYDI